MSEKKYEDRIAVETAKLSRRNLTDVQVVRGYLRSVGMYRTSIGEVVHDQTGGLGTGELYIKKEAYRRVALERGYTAEAMEGKF